MFPPISNTFYYTSDPKQNSRFLHLYFFSMSLLIVQLCPNTTKFLGLLSPLMGHTALFLPPVKQMKCQLESILTNKQTSILMIL